MAHSKNLSVSSFEENVTYPLMLLMFLSKKHKLHLQKIAMSIFEKIKENVTYSLMLLRFSL